MRKKFKKVLSVLCTFMLVIIALFNTKMTVNAADSSKYIENFNEDKEKYPDIDVENRGKLNVKHYDVSIDLGDTLPDERHELFGAEAYTDFILQNAENGDFAKDSTGALYFDYNWDEDGSNPAFQNTICIWGYLVPEESGKYELDIRSDDGSYGEIIINNKTKVFTNDWQYKSPSRDEDNNRTFRLEEGEIYPIYIEYFENKQSEAAFSIQMKEKGFMGGIFSSFDDVPSTWFYPTTLDKSWRPTVEAPSINAEPDNDTEATNVLVELTNNDDPEKTFLEYKIGEDGPWETYNSSFTIDYNTIIYGRAISNLVSNAYSEEISYSINNVIAPPDKPTILTPERDIITNDETIFVTGISDPNLRIELLIKDEEENYVEEATNSDENGEWGIPVNCDNLLDGEIEINAIARNDLESCSEPDKVIIIKDTISPTSPEITVDPESLTNENVIVTITDTNTPNENIIYKEDNGEWIDYTGAFEVSENTNITAKAIDNAGNESEEVIREISNIDTDPPDKPVITNPMPESIINSDELTVTGRGEVSSIINISIKNISGSTISQTINKEDNDGNWSYTFNTSTLDDGKLFIAASARDEIGNESDEDIITIYKDTTPPSSPVIDIDPEELTNSSVRVEIIGTDDQGDTIFYKVNNEGWQEYTESFIVEENVIIKAKTVDNAGNESEIATKDITNIDREGPERPVIQSPYSEEIINDNTITVSGTGEPEAYVEIMIIDSVEHNVDGYDFVNEEGNWSVDIDISELLEGELFISAYSYDELENMSEGDSVIIYKDITPPDTPEITIDPTTRTSGSVKVTIEGETEEDTIFYKKGENDEWQTYVEPFKVSSNTTIYAKAVDNAENESEVVEKEIENIRKVNSGPSTPHKPFYEEETDLLLKAYSNNKQVRRDEELEVNLTLGNKQDTEARNIKITSEIPEGFSLTNVEEYNYTVSEGILTITVPKLNKKENLDIKIIYTVDSEIDSITKSVINYEIEEKDNYINLEDDKAKVVLLVYPNDFEGLHKKYIEGFPDEEFKPNQNLTRAEISTMLVEALELDMSKLSDTFDKELEGHWAKDYIGCVAEAGIVIGYEDGTFRPDEPITRGELATIIAKVLKLEEKIKENSHFIDIDAHWARGYIDAIYYFSIISGYEDDTFKPNNYILRSEAVVMINKLLFRGPLMTEERIFTDCMQDDWFFGDVMEAGINHIYKYDGEVEKHIR
ncbi:MAG: S-layer homology domain-containing protein [Eubacteriales bacterium]